MSNGKQRISEMLGKMDPDARVVIQGMLVSNDVDFESTIGELIPKIGNLKGSKEERIALLKLLYVDGNKFAPKLDFEKRCQILALNHTGITREALAKMYNVDRRTVTHICNPLSHNYKNVREHEIGLGTERFRKEYLNDTLINQALAFRQENEKEANKNNKFAKMKEGIHVVKTANCEYEHRVIIGWREDEGEPGWYYKDMDGNLPDRWLCSDDESMKTSQSCYIAMLKEIADKLNPT